MDIHDIAFAAAFAKGSGGGTPGTTDYTDLTNKPQINGVTLSENKTTEQLGITEIWVGTQAQYVSNPPAVGQPYIITDDADIDSTPTANSDNPVTSGGVYSSLARLDPLTGDIYFGQTRVARVMDSDSYAALTTKDNIYYLTYPSPSPTPTPSLSMSSGAKGAGETPDEKELETKKNTEMEISDERLWELPPFGFGGYDE